MKIEEIHQTFEAEIIKTNAAQAFKVSLLLDRVDPGIFINTSDKFFGNAFQESFPTFSYRGERWGARSYSLGVNEDCSHFTHEAISAAWNKMPSMINQVMDAYIANEATNQIGRYPKTLQSVADETDLQVADIDAVVKAKFRSLADLYKAENSYDKKSEISLEIRNLYDNVRSISGLKIFVRDNMQLPVASSGQVVSSTPVESALAVSSVTSTNNPKSTSAASAVSNLSTVFTSVSLGGSKPKV